MWTMSEVQRQYKASMEKWVKRPWGMGMTLTCIELLFEADKESLKAQIFV